MKPWKRQLNSAAGGAQKVRHLPRQRELISLFQANKLCSKAEANSLKVATLVIKTRCGPDTTPRIRPALVPKRTACAFGGINWIVHE